MHQNKDIDDPRDLAKLALAAISEGVVITDATQRVLQVNPAFETITQYPAAEMIAKTCKKLQGPLTDLLTVQAMRLAMAQHKAFSGVVLNYRKDGSTFWNALSISPLRDANGDLTHYIGVMRDISERKRTEAALRESEARYQHAAEAAGGYIMEGDTQFRFTFVSERAQQLLGYTADEMVGRTPAEFMPPGEIERVNAWFESNPQIDHSIRGLEHRTLTKSGAIIWLQISRMPLYDNEGKVKGFRGTAFDITPRKLAEAAHAELETQLRESHKMEAIGTLAGGIAHDFNNIMAAILGNVNLARQDLSPASPAHESLDEIHKAASRARDLVRQILAFSRREQTSYKRTALSPIVTETARMLRAMLPARITIEVDSAPHVSDVAADGSQIQQVIINLVTNATQAMGGAAGRVRIGLDTEPPDKASLAQHTALRTLHQQHPAGLVRLSISDDGPGIEKALVGRIFDPFFTTKPVGEGTGLGLAVVQGIVRGHQGQVVVDSQIGVGTRFDLYFPSDATPPDEHAESAQPAPSERVQRAAKATHPDPVASQGHIVYVDDDESLVFLVKRLLERRGYKVSAHQDQEAALLAVAADPAGIDLFLTDYNMPGQSGLDLARQVRAIRPDLPIGITSGFIDEVLSAGAESAGIQGLIFKATSVEEFCSAIEALLKPKT